MDHTEDFNEAIDMEHVADSIVDSIDHGSVVQGEIVTIDSEFAYVNVGMKSDGRISLEEFIEKPQVGQIVDVMLQNKRLVDGVLQFSKRAAESQKKWNEFITWYNEGNTVIEGKIIEATNKGKIVDCKMINAFLPFSLAADVKAISKSDDTHLYQIKSMDRKKKSVILSRKDYLEEELDKLWVTFLEKYNEGDKINGTIVKFVEFGAFVRIEGIDALLHRNDMSWKNVFKQRKLFRLGEETEFIILNINKEDRKISLGYKQLKEDPWVNISERYSVGDIVDGVVVTITGMGAFVEIENEIEGFLSASEISWTKTAISVKDVLVKNQELKLMILDINAEERKLSLGLKQTLDNPWENIDQSYPVGSIHKRAIKKIVKFGMFVELESDIDGLVHISDISWDDNIKNISDHHKEGDEVEFKILDIKKNEMKISCGIKQLLKSPWEVIKENYPPRTKVEGIISGITDFGIFIKLEDNVEGLAHISEVSTKRIEDLNNHFEVGAPIAAVVLDVNTEKKRLSLSIKHLEMQSEKEELKRILNETSPSTVTLGDMIDLSLKDKKNGEN